MPVRGAAPARGETFQDGRGTWTAGAALRVIVVLLTCSPSGERRVLSSAGAAVAWSSPGAPTRAGGCRPTSRGFASELMTCPALLHLSDRISAVLLDVREHTNGTDRSQRSMARSHIPELGGTVLALCEVRTGFEFGQLRGRLRLGSAALGGRCAGGPLRGRRVGGPFRRRSVTSAVRDLGRLSPRRSLTSALCTDNFGHFGPLHPAASDFGPLHRRLRSLAPGGERLRSQNVRCKGPKSAPTRPVATTALPQCSDPQCSARSPPRSLAAAPLSRRAALPT